MAIEDAVVLARALADRRGDIEGAFRSYQSKRKERVERVAAEVGTMGRIYNFGSPLRGALLHSTMWLMSRLSRGGVPERFAWIDGYDALSA
jgi:2-polyprenyl-6-methoxyphenol hydroxylase-like FAD-dependent oxidoreductase